MNKGNEQGRRMDEEGCEINSEKTRHGLTILHFFKVGLRNISSRLFYRFSVDNDGRVEPHFRGSALVPRENSAAVALIFTTRDTTTTGVVTVL